MTHAEAGLIAAAVAAIAVIAILARKIKALSPHSSEPQGVLASQIENSVNEALRLNTREFFDQAERTLRQHREQETTDHKTRHDHLHKELERFGQRIEAAEAKLSGEYHGLKERTSKLGDNLQKLTGMLGSGRERGQWGEHQLRRILELSGLINRADFDLQPTIKGGARPDCIIRRAGHAC